MAFIRPYFLRELFHTRKVLGAMLGWESCFPEKMAIVCMWVRGDAIAFQMGNKTRLEERR